MRKKITAVIVTFFPEKKNLKTILELKEYFSSIVLIDNTPGGVNDFFNDNSELLSKFVIIKNTKNMGLGYALNQGIKESLKTGSEFTLFFDQDTELFDNGIKSLLDTAGMISGEKWILGSNYFNVFKNRIHINPDCVNNQEFVKTKNIITSGSLFPNSVFKNIGFFDESFFIDSIDIEYNLRARKAGYEIFITKKPILVQQIGNKSENKGGYFWRSYVHSPDRSFYIVRNTLYVIKKYLWFDPLECLVQIIRLNILFLSILLFQKQKSLRMKNYFQGLFHGFFPSMNRDSKTR